MLWEWYVWLLLGRALQSFRLVFDCRFMGYIQYINIILLSHTDFFTFILIHRSSGDGQAALELPLSPRLFCCWVEPADRSSGTAMGSSASSDASLAGGLSLSGVETHTSKHPSLTTQPPRHDSFRGSKITSPSCKSLFVGLLYLLCAFYSSIMQ